MATFHQQLSELLGVRATEKDSGLLDLIEQRLPTSAIARLLALGITRPEIDAVVVPLRTLQHRRSRREKLTIDESDRVLRLARVLSQTENLYGSRERALSWLRTPTPRLGGRAPLSLLNTEAGSRLVEELLVQIDEGMFV